MSNRIDRYSKRVTLALILAIIGSGCNNTAIPPAQLAPTASIMPTPTVSMVHTSMAGEDTPATTVPDHMQPMPAPKGVLYQDDFTDPNSGWPNGIAFDNYYIGYHEPSYYHVEVHVPRDKAVINLPQQRFDDFTVETKLFVEQPNTAQDGDFRYGLLFRRSGSQYYAFTISPRTKTWYVLKSSPTGLAELKQGHDDSIQGLTAADTLRVDARGSTFFFHINDQPIDQVSDPDYASGEVGFYVETFDSPRVHIHYDSLTVHKVEAPKLLCSIVVSGLNLREGPGTTYTIIGSAARDTQLEPLGRSADGSWIYVRVADTKQLAWVSSAAIYVSCNMPVNDLPVREP